MTRCVWGKEGKVTPVMLGGKLYAIGSYRKDSRSDDLRKSNACWIFFDIFCVSDTDRSSGNLDLVFRRDKRLATKM